MTLNEFIKVLQEFQDKGCGDYEVLEEYYGESFSIDAGDIWENNKDKKIYI